MTPWLHADFTRRFPGISICGAFTWHDRPRRVTALFGPSGSGKTTILRCLAGLEFPDAGSIQFHGETWCDVSRRIHVPPQKRRVGFLFQEYMLFPHLSVRDNVAFGARLHPRSGGRQVSNVDGLLERFQLTGLGDRWPRELSGGQQQRVALARVLAAQPRLLCLDEPLSALDGPTRTELRMALRDWLHAVQLPALIVSHDAVEVQTLADDVIILSDGQMRQSGSVAEVWHHPLDASVARIVGYDNILPVQVLGGSPDQLRVLLDQWQVVGSSRGPLAVGAEARLCIRAEDLTLIPLTAPPAENSGCSEATVIEVIPEGGLWRARLKLRSGTVLQAVISRSTFDSLQPRANDQLLVSVAPHANVIVPAD